MAFLSDRFHDVLVLKLKLGAFLLESCCRVRTSRMGSKARALKATLSADEFSF
jgi:hypothetical protein